MITHFNQKWLTLGKKRLLFPVEDEKLNQPNQQKLTDLNRTPP